MLHFFPPDHVSGFIRENLTPHSSWLRYCESGTDLNRKENGQQTVVRLT